MRSASGLAKRRLDGVGRRLHRMRRAGACSRIQRTAPDLCSRRSNPKLHAGHPSHQDPTRWPSEVHNCNIQPHVDGGVGAAGGAGDGVASWPARVWSR